MNEWVAPTSCYCRVAMRTLNLSESAIFFGTLWSWVCLVLWCMYSFAVSDVARLLLLLLLLLSRCLPTHTYRYRMANSTGVCCDRAHDSAGSRSVFCTSVFFPCCADIDPSSCLHLYIVVKQVGGERLNTVIDRYCFLCFWHFFPPLLRDG